MANNPTKYLEVIGKIVKKDMANNETDVPMYSGTQIKYLKEAEYTKEDGTKVKKLQDAEDVDYQPLNTSDNIFFFQGMGKTYDMSEIHPKENQEAGSVRIAATDTVNDVKHIITSLVKIICGADGS